MLNSGPLSGTIRRQWTVYEVGPDERPSSARSEARNNGAPTSHLSLPGWKAHTGLRNPAEKWYSVAHTQAAGSSGHEWEHSKPVVLNFLKLQFFNILSHVVVLPQL